MNDLILSTVVVAITYCQLVSGRNEGGAEAQRRRGAEAANKFAADFSKAVMGKKNSRRSGPENLFFSPISVYLAFAMTYAGAKGRTASQLENVLKWSDLGSKRHEAIEEMIDSVIGSFTKNGQTLNLANKLWLQFGFCTSSCDNFINILKTNYNTDLGLVNFIEKGPCVRLKINKWVEQKTAYKVRKLLKPGLIDTATRLIITNAIYFKSNWKYQFDSQRTIPMSFTTTRNSRSNELRVPMMNLDDNFPYYEDDLYKVLELPYAVPEVSMTIFLPRESDLENFQEDFNLEFVNRYHSLLRTRKVRIAIPKFKITADLNLKDIFKSLGVRDLFSSEADLSGILGYRGLFVAAAIHKAFVDVSEEGTEAAAANAVVFGSRTASSDESTFIANHPFVFLIRHIPSSAILFFGQVVNPVV